MTSWPKGTLGQLYAEVRVALVNADVEDAAREARRLIGGIVGIPSEMFLGHPEHEIADADRDRVLVSLRERVGGRSIGRIVGEREFYGRSFAITPAVLEPRADSEVLVDAALEIVRDANLRAVPMRIVDVGTGSGCLLITLLAELPLAHGVGLDLSAAALQVAVGNAERHDVQDRVQFVPSDGLSAVDGEFDLLISNPPYIRSSDIAGLNTIVRDYDPVLALDGGDDGLDVYRRIADDLLRVVPNGWVLFEVGAGMTDLVCHEIDRISSASESRDWRVWQDINGHGRCVSAKTLNA